MSDWILEKSQNEAEFDFCKFGPISITWLRGDPIRRAKTYCRMVERGFFSRRVVNFFGDRALMPLKGQPHEPIVKTALNTLNFFSSRKIPRELRPEMAELEHTFGKALTRRAIQLPDLGSSINALQANEMLKPYIPEMGCTSVGRDNGENFVFGRNLDFDGTDVFDRYPSIIVHQPAAGRELKHASFTADGMFWASITGINEAGIILCLHQNFSDVSSFGVPILAIGELVMREARNLDHAIAILDQYKPGPMWTFVLTDLNAQKTISVETSSAGLSVRDMQGEQFVQTNHLVELSDREFAPFATHQNSLLRWKTAEDQHPGTAQEMIALLEQQSDSNGELSMYKDILKPQTLHTLVVESNQEQATVYFSGDQAPSASGRFAVFDLEDLWGGFKDFSASMYETRVKPEVREKQKQAALAYGAYFDHQDYDKTLQLIDTHKSLTAQCLKACCHFQLNNFSAAIELVESALPNAGDYTENFQILKLLCLIKLQRSTEARDFAAELNDMSMPKLQEIVDSVKKGSWPEPSLFFDFFSGQIYSRPARPK